ncbi:MAG: ABC transporter ATP-binding protein [bacterium]
MIEANNLRKKLGEQWVLDDLSLTVPEGDIVALLGTSGAGKSVLLRNIVGLMKPDSGTVTINDINVHKAGSSRIESLRNMIGMLFQGGALFDSMTVRENLAFPLREKTDLTPNDIEDRITTRLDRVNMSGTEDKYPAELSGGMQKRVALARAMIRNPDIIFFDEPTTGLDPIIANSILRLIHRLHDEFKFTAVIVTHNFDKVFEIVDHVAMIKYGKIIAHQTPDEFMNSDDDDINTFVNEAMKGPLEAET